MSDEQVLSTSPKKNYAGLIGLAVVAALGGGLWYYSDVAFNYAGADEQCIRFAEDSDVHIASKPYLANIKIFVANKWIKGRYVVVELG